MARIEWTEAAAADIKRLDRAVALKIHRKLTWLSENLQRVVPKALGGEWKGTFRLRVGHWRVGGEIQMTKKGGT